MKIPSAENFRKQNTTTAFINSNKECEKCMIEFAKLHVKAALEEASKNSFEVFNDGSKNMMNLVIKESISSAYPESKIK